MKHIDAQKHVTGRSLYVDDVPQREGTLHAVVLGSPEAHGKLRAIHVEQALQAQGVVAILTAKDIPGENQIGGIFPDEPLLADGEVHYRAQPIAIIVADSDHHARLGFPNDGGRGSPRDDVGDGGGSFGGFIANTIMWLFGIALIVAVAFAIIAYVVAAFVAIWMLVRGIPMFWRLVRR